MAQKKKESKRRGQDRYTPGEYVTRETFKPKLTKRDPLAKPTDLELRDAFFLLEDIEEVLWQNSVHSTFGRLQGKNKKATPDRTHLVASVPRRLDELPWAHALKKRVIQTAEEYADAADYGNDPTPFLNLIELYGPWVFFQKHAFSAQRVIETWWQKARLGNKEGKELWARFCNALGRGVHGTELQSPTLEDLDHRREKEREEKQRQREKAMRAKWEQEFSAAYPRYPSMNEREKRQALKGFSDGKDTTVRGKNRKALDDFIGEKAKNLKQSK